MAEPVLKASDIPRIFKLLERRHSEGRAASPFINDPANQAQLRRMFLRKTDQESLLRESALLAAASDIEKEWLRLPESIRVQIGSNLAPGSIYSTMLERFGPSIENPTALNPGLTQDALFKMREDIRRLRRGVAPTQAEAEEDIDRDLASQQFRGGPVGETLGAFGSGILEVVDPVTRLATSSIGGPLSHILAGQPPLVDDPETGRRSVGIGDLFERDLPHGASIGIGDAGRLASQRAIQETGTAPRLANVAGNLLPIITGAGAMGTALRAAGMTTLPAAFLTGAAVGAGTTPGGVKERAIGAGLSGTAFAASAGLMQAVRPRLATLQQAMLGVNPNVAQRLVARSAPQLASAMLDAAAFTPTTVIERAMHGEPVDLAQIYQDNLITMLVARGMHITGGLPADIGRRVRRGPQRALIEEAFNPEGRPAPILELDVVERHLLGQQFDAVLVATAKRAALRGHRVSVDEARQILRDPVKAMQTLAPERIQQLYRPSAEEVVRRRGETMDRAAEVRQEMIESARKKRIHKIALPAEEKARKFVEQANARREKKVAKANELTEQAEKIRIETKNQVERRRLAALEARAAKSYEQLEAEGRPARTPADRIREGAELNKAEQKMVEPMAQRIAEEIAQRRVRPPEENPRANELRAEAEILKAEIAENGPANQILKGAHRFPIRDLINESPIQPPRRENAAQPWTQREMLQALREAGIAPKFIDTKRQTGGETGATPLDQAVSGMPPGAVFEQLVKLSQPGRKNLKQIRGSIRKLERDARKLEREADSTFDREMKEAVLEARPEAEKRARGELAMEYERARIEENPRLMGDVEFDPMLFEPPTEAARSAFRARQAEIARPADPKRADALDADATRIIDSAGRKLQQLDKRVSNIIREADRAHRKDMAATRPLLRRAQRAREFVPRRLRNLEELSDASIGMTPRESRAMNVLENGRVAEVKAVMDAMRAENGIPYPEAELKMPDVATPEGVRTTIRMLRETPPADPGVARGNMYSDVADVTFGAARPMPWDWLRGAWKTNLKFLGPVVGQQLYDIQSRAAMKASRFQTLYRERVIGETFRDYSRWLRRLPNDQMRLESLEKLRALDEGGPRVGTSAEETAMLQTLHLLFGRIQRQMKGIGRPTREGGYFPKMFETVEAHGVSAELARAVEMLGLGQPSGRGKARTGSRFFNRRVSDRTFTLESVEQLGTILDAYINSSQRAIAWEPVRRYIERRVKPHLLDINRRMVQQRKGIQREREEGDLTKRVLDFIVKQTESAAGRSDSVVDAADAYVTETIRRWGFRDVRNQQIGRRLLNATVAAQYYAGLGYNLGSATKNLTQFFTNTIGAVGLRHAMKAALWDMWVYQKNFKTGRRRIMLNPMIRASGVLDAGFAQSIRGSDRFGANIKNAIRKYGAKTAMALFQGAETFNRAATYMAGYNAARARGIGDAQARKAGRNLVAETQFDYIPGLSGMAFNGPAAHAFFQFQRFPLYQMDWLDSVARRSVEGDLRRLPPGEADLALAFRYALAQVGLQAALSGIGMDLADSFGIGGIPEPLKVAISKPAQELGQSIAMAQGEPGIEGDIAAQEVLNRMGLLPFSGSFISSTTRSAGPLVGTAVSVMDLMLGTPREQKNAERELQKTWVRMMPGGLAVHRLARYRQEVKDGHVRDTRTGEIMFPIGKADILLRLAGLNTRNVVDQYDAISSVKYRESVMQSEIMRLYQDSRLRFHDLLIAEDPDAAAKGFATFERGINDVFAMTGVYPFETIDDLIRAYRDSVVIQVLHGEQAPKVQRILEGNRRLREQMRAVEAASVRDREAELAAGD